MHPHLIELKCCTAVELFNIRKNSIKNLLLSVHDDAHHEKGGGKVQQWEKNLLKSMSGYLLRIFSSFHVRKIVDFLLTLCECGLCTKFPLDVIQFSGLVTQLKEDVKMWVKNKFLMFEQSKFCL